MYSHFKQLIRPISLKLSISVAIATTICFLVFSFFSTPAFWGGMSLITAILIFAVSFFVSAMLVKQHIISSLTELKNTISCYNVHAPIELQKDEYLQAINNLSHLDNELGEIAKTIEEKYREQSQLLTTDPLTQLPNRKGFLETLPAGLERNIRNKTMMAVLFLGINNFKKINDNLGYPIGDALLTDLSRRLKTASRNANYLARVGGDEFAILIEDVTNQEDVLKIAQRIIKEIKYPANIKRYKLDVSFSLGIAIYPEGGATASELFKHADSAMYRAKKNENSNIVIYDKTFVYNIERRNKIEMALSNAISNQEFELHFQPQIDLNNKKMFGIEALIRWHNPKLGNPKPEEFIKVAEINRKMGQLGQWVFKNAVEQLQSIQTAINISQLKLAINVSSVELLSSKYIEQISSILKEIPIENNLISIELSENHLAQHIEIIKPVLTKIADLGVNIVLDDFGKAFSSFQYLRNLPISSLKIDQSFIEGIQFNERDEEIIKSIISLSNSLNMECIAKGIEHDYQAKFVKENGCHLAQGYLFAHPMPHDKLIQFLINAKSQKSS